MSAPATNARSPAPVRTIAPTSVSRARSLRALSSSSSRAVERAFSASGRVIVTTATRSSTRRSIMDVLGESVQAWVGAYADGATGRRARPSAGRGVRREVVDDRAGRRAGGEDLGHPALLQLGGVLARDRPADDDEHVVRLVLGQEVEDPRHQGHVGAG